VLLDHGGCDPQFLIWIARISLSSLGCLPELAAWAQVGKFVQKGLNNLTFLVYTACHANGHCRNQESLGGKSDSPGNFTKARKL
jgi:hypothetical protein